MRKLVYIFISCLLLAGINGCTDDFEDINTDNTKLYDDDVDLDQVFAGTVKRTLDLVAGENIYWVNAANYASINYAITPRQTADGNGIFGTAYKTILRDMEILDTKYAQDTTGVYNNRRAVILTWKSYIYYLLASIYGPVPMSDAIVKGLEIKTSYKYDDEKTVYSQILRNLALADTLFNAETTWADDLSFPDPVFGSAVGDYENPDISKWETFANTFRLHVAMHAQNVLDADSVAYHAQAALNKPAKLISSLNQAVAPSFGSYDEGAASSYFTRRKTDEDMKRWNTGNYFRFSEYMYIYMATFKDPRLSRYALPLNYYAKKFESSTWVETVDNTYQFTDTLTRVHSCVDPRLATATAETVCEDFSRHQDGLNMYRRDSILVRYRVDYLPHAGGNREMPGSWIYRQVQLQNGMHWDQGQAVYLPDYTNVRFENNIGRDGGGEEYNVSYVAERFTAESAPVVLLSWADACFLKAEATLYLRGSDTDAKTFYEEGIKASFAQYGVTSSDTINAYLTQPGVAWRTDRIGYATDMQLYRASILGASGTKDLTGGSIIEDGALDQIYKQRWMAGFFNGLEGWNLERRTRAMNFLPTFSRGASTSVDGARPDYNYWTERYVYPAAEMTNNGEAYWKGVAMLQEDSPYKRPDRNGDNVFTSLAFAKEIPDIETAGTRFGGYREITSNCEYLHRYYGNTYEEVEAYCLKIANRTLPPPTSPGYPAAYRAAVQAGKNKLLYEHVQTLYWYYETQPPQ